MTIEFHHRGVRYEIIDNGGPLTIRRYTPIKRGPVQTHRAHWRLVAWSSPRYREVERAYRGQP